jgi:hypothetical protein
MSSRLRLRQAAMRFHMSRSSAVCRPVFRALRLPGCPPRRRFAGCSGFSMAYSFSVFGYPLPPGIGVFDDHAVAGLGIVVDPARDLDQLAA